MILRFDLLKYNNKKFKNIFDFYQDMLVSQETLLKTLNIPAEYLYNSKDNLK